MIKDESPDEVIESFVGIGSKCYSFITKNNVVKKAKDTQKRVKINAIRTLKSIMNKFLFDTRQTRLIKQG